MRDGDRADAATIAALVVAVLAISASGLDRGLRGRAGAGHRVLAQRDGGGRPGAGRRRCAGATSWSGWPGPAGGTWLVCVLAGVALAAHFATWVPSDQADHGRHRHRARRHPAGVAGPDRGRPGPAAARPDLGRHRRGGGRGARGDRRRRRGVRAPPSSATCSRSLGGLAAAVYTALGERARDDDQHHLVHRGLLRRLRGGCCCSSAWSAGTPLTGYPASAWLALVAPDRGPAAAGPLAVQLRAAPGHGDHGLGADPAGGARARRWSPGPGSASCRRPAAWPGLALLLAGRGHRGPRRAAGPATAPVRRGADPLAIRSAASGRRRQADRGQAGLPQPGGEAPGRRPWAAGGRSPQVHVVAARGDPVRGPPWPARPASRPPWPACAGPARSGRRTGTSGCSLPNRVRTTPGW